MANRFNIGMRGKGTRTHNERMVLSYDCLVPEEAYKILDVLLSDDMCEMMQWYETELSYGTYRIMRDDKPVWARDLCIFVSAPEVPNNDGVDIDALLQQDKEELKKIAEIVEARTNIAWED